MTVNYLRERLGPPGHQIASVSAILSVLHLFFGSMKLDLYLEIYLTMLICRSVEKSVYTLLVTM